MGALSTTVVSFVALHSTTIHFVTFQRYINNACHSASSGGNVAPSHLSSPPSLSHAGPPCYQVLIQATLTDVIAAQRRGRSVQVQQTCTRRVPANVGGGLPLACIDRKVSCTLVDADHLHHKD